MLSVNQELILLRLMNHIDVIYFRSPKVLPEVEKEVEMTNVKPFTYGPMPTQEYGPSKPVFDKNILVQAIGNGKE
jgi:hypothetical protein